MVENVLIQNVIVSLISYVLGIGTGVWVSDALRKKNIPLSPSKDGGNQLVLVIVTSIWFISMLIDIASPAYETSPYVHGLMGAIVGFFYRKQNENDNKK